MSTVNEKPNIILILADDMGFSDLGITGSEIQTPCLDMMARSGLLLTSMYNCARCCPTRASLLTGLYPHKAGIGHMTPDLGLEAYQGYLKSHALTIAEILKISGYQTLMSGKWHVGGNYVARDADDWTPGDSSHPTPRQRGFERFFGIVDGSANHFSPHHLMEDDKRIEVEPGFYFTDTITNKAIQMIKETDENKPFFLYLGHTAPHWPLQAPEETISKYENSYSRGWDYIRGARHEQMNSHGILRQNWKLSPRDESAPAWTDIKHTEWEAMKMAVYAAQIDRMDQSIGRLISSLKQQEKFDNTLILFLSDNGGCAEFLAEDGFLQRFPETTADGKKVTLGNIVGVRPGPSNTFMSYDLPWSNVSNSPFRLHKHWVHEGGISTPMIVHWPAKIRKSNIVHEPVHVVDILPTILEVSGVSYPNENKERSTMKLDGESILPLIYGKDWQRQQPIFWEHEGNSAIRLDNMKLVRQHGQPWELYDMDDDRTEQKDLIGTNSPVEDMLKHEYTGWEEACGVEDWSIIEERFLKAYKLKSLHG
ncbi:arylsulfatase [Candidatus Puniceispirillum sp.]|nr:arylsulfatase [Candidatus Puniceispirillum sp.]